MKKNIKLTEVEYRRHCDDMDGVCIECHAVTFGDVEQDVEGRTCDSCEKETVMGFEQAAIHELLEIVEEGDEDGASA